MSEEIKKEENQKECNCETKFKITILVLVIVSLIMSIASLTMSVINLGGNNGAQVHTKKVVISKQYDKGQSFDKAKATGKPMLVFFYTDWCGFCQKFVPTFAKVSKDTDVKKNIAIAYVNCENTENQSLIKEFGIQAFPTVYVIKENGDKIKLDNNMLFEENAKQIIKDKVFEIVGR